MTTLYAYAMGEFPRAGIEMIAERPGHLPVLSIPEIELIISSYIDGEIDEDLAASLREQMTPPAIFKIWNAARLQNEQHFEAEQIKRARKAAAAPKSRGL